MLTEQPSLTAACSSGAAAAARHQSAHPRGCHRSHTRGTASRPRCARAAPRTGAAARGNAWGEPCKAAEPLGWEGKALLRPLAFSSRCSSSASLLGEPSLPCRVGGLGNAAPQGQRQLSTGQGCEGVSSEPLRLAESRSRAGGASPGWAHLHQNPSVRTWLGDSWGKKQPEINSSPLLELVKYFFSKKKNHRKSPSPD